MCWHSVLLWATVQMRACSDSLLPSVQPADGQRAATCTQGKEEASLWIWLALALTRLQ